jgi:plasmid stabilization system protein ParE
MFDAACFYELQAPSLGQDFLSKVELAIRSIVDSPERWPIVRSDIRRHLVQRFPFSLLYRVDAEEIVILAVMHHKRHPAYWLSRKHFK